MTSTNKRFIAGAVCPRCGAMDRILMYTEGEKRFRECVRCGFADEMRFFDVGREPETRVNRTPEERRAEVRTVKLVDPGKSEGSC